MVLHTALELCQQQQPVATQGANLPPLQTDRQTYGPRSGRSGPARGGAGAAGTPVCQLCILPASEGGTARPGGPGTINNSEAHITHLRAESRWAPGPDGEEAGTGGRLAGRPRSRADAPAGEREKTACDSHQETSLSQQCQTHLDLGIPSRGTRAEERKEGAAGTHRDSRDTDTGEQGKRKGTESKTHNAAAESHSDLCALNIWESSPTEGLKCASKPIQNRESLQCDFEAAAQNCSELGQLSGEYALVSQAENKA